MSLGNFTMEAGFAYYITDANDWARSKVIQRRREAAQQQALAQSPPESEWTSSPTTPGSPSSTSGKQLTRGDSLTSGMDIVIPSPTTPFATSQFNPAPKAKVQDPEDVLLATPYETRHSRRYLRELPYLLPCDLAEMHRQSLRTLLGATVFSKAVCCPAVDQQLPKKVLELGCGSAFWTSTCHDYFASLGHTEVSFTGIDIASLAPNLSDQGVDWKFIQHDLRKFPWPFADEEFDYIMIKDLSLAIPLHLSQRLIEECIRILREDGNLEIWESDHILRCLMPHNRPPPAGTDERDEAAATHTRTFLITPGMPFAPAQNKFIADSNSWIELACDKRKLPSTPCARVAETLYQEPDLLHNVGSRRVAIPLTELPWESQTPGSRKHSRTGTGGKSLVAKTKSKGGVGGESGGLLTPDQAAVRYTALMTVVQKIESLEPVLKEFSGKNTEEWATWWANMMSDLLDQNGVGSGECLEIGAWWATKKKKKQP